MRGAHHSHRRSIVAAAANLAIETRLSRSALNALLRTMAQDASHGGSALLDSKHESRADKSAAEANRAVIDRIEVSFSIGAGAPARGGRGAAGCARRGRAS